MAKKYIYAALSLAFIFLIIFSGMNSILAENASDLDNLTFTEGIIGVSETSDNTSVASLGIASLASENELKIAKIKNSDKIEKKLMKKLEKQLDISYGVASEEDELSNRFLVYANSRKNAEKIGKKNANEVALVEDLDINEILELVDNEDVEYIMEEPVLSIEAEQGAQIINADDVWDYIVVTDNTILDGRGGSVCVLDTGVDYNHANLSGRIINGPDFVNEDSDPMDDHGHGTHVAGIVRFTAPGSKIVSVKICNAAGGCGGFDMMQGVQWCTDHKEEYNISVITMSIGDKASWNDSNCPNWMDSTLQYAIDEELYVTAASGNEGYTTGINYPACSAYTISVGATTKTDGIAVFTNRFANLDIMAPGASIVSTCLNGGTCMKSGTSMATPFVAAGINILKRSYDARGITRNTSQIRQTLKNTGVNISGYKRISLSDAVLEDYESLFVISPMTAPGKDEDQITEKIKEINSSSKIEESLKSRLIDELKVSITGPAMPGTTMPLRVLIIADEGVNASEIIPFYPGNDAIDNFGLVNLELSNVDAFLELANKENVEFIMEEPVLSADNIDVINIINSEDVNPISMKGVNLDGTGTAVCLIDTGVDYNHANLSGKIINGPDFVNDDADSMDDNGHGTHIAGTILAVAPETKVIAVKVCTAAGGCGGFDMMQGVQWCTANKDTYNIKSISISIGDKASWNDSNCPNWMDTHLQSAYNQNIFVAAASGNEGSTTGINYPACSAYTTSVGATTKAGGIAVFTNRFSNLDIMAPGASIISTCLNGGTCMKSGTSMATPVIAASATILKQYYGLASMSKTNEEIEQLMKDTGVNILGYKRIDLKAAVDKDELYKNLSSSCGLKLTENMTLTEDVNCVGDENDYALQINTSGVVLDCDGHSISGDSKYGVFAYKQSTVLGNVEIKNCKFNGFENGIYVQNVNKTIITGNDVSATLHGIVVSNDAFNNATVKNNTVKGDTGFGIYLRGVENGLVEDNFIDGGKNGVYMSKVSGTTIKDNDIIGTSGSGMHIKPANNSLITGNNISYGGLGIRIYWQGGTAGDNNVIDGNTITNNNWNGIWTYTEHGVGVNGTIIRNNYLENNNLAQPGGWYNADIKVEGKNTLVENNTIKNSKANAAAILTLWNYTQGTVIRNNTIDNSSVAGIRLWMSLNDVVEDNTLIDAKTGIVVWHSNESIIRNNEILESSSAISLASKDTEGFEIYNNKLHDNDYGIYFSDINHVNVHDNLITDNNKAGIFYRGILDPAVYNDLNVYHNNIYNNSLVQVRDDGTWPAREVSYNNQGNYWGHNSGNCFVPANDSNKAWVSDSYCYLSIGGWNLNESEVLEPAINPKKSGGSSSSKSEPEEILETDESVEIPVYGAVENQSSEGIVTGHASFYIEDEELLIGEDIIVESAKENESYLSIITGGFIGSVREGLKFDWLMDLFRNLFS